MTKPGTVDSKGYILVKSTLHNWTQDGMKREKWFINDDVILVIVLSEIIKQISYE